MIYIYMMLFSFYHIILHHIIYIYTHTSLGLQRPKGSCTVGHAKRFKSGLLPARILDSLNETNSKIHCNTSAQMIYIYMINTNGHIYIYIFDYGIYSFTCLAESIAGYLALPKTAAFGAFRAVDSLK